MSLLTEIHFENEICDDLAEQNWLSAEGDNTHFHRARVLSPEDVLSRVKETQAITGEASTKNRAPTAGDAIRDRHTVQITSAATSQVNVYGLLSWPTYFLSIRNSPSGGEPAQLPIS